jgi:glucokinase
VSSAAVPGGFVIGVDVGGTKVAAGIVTRDGTIEAHTRAPMKADGDAEAGLGAVKAVIDSLLQRKGDQSSVLRGIGICSPGPLDPHTGVVINPPNLPCWRNFPLASRIAEACGVPVKLENDANAAALAEALWGAGRGYQNVFCATLGTGIGTGIVFGGKVYHGRTGAAGEGGHISIDYRGPLCRCGKRGCIEAYASGPAIVRRTCDKLYAQAAFDSAILDLAGGNRAAISSEMVGQAYEAGDRMAAEILQETAELLTHWLGTIVDLLEPDILIMGGGVAAMLRPFFDQIRNRLPGCSVNSRCQEIPLVMAAYGNQAGIAGGAALCSENLG